MILGWFKVFFWFLNSGADSHTHRQTRSFMYIEDFIVTFFTCYNLDYPPVNITTPHLVCYLQALCLHSGLENILNKFNPICGKSKFSDSYFFSWFSRGYTGCFIMNATKVFLNNFYSKAPYALKWVPYLHW